MTCRPTNKSLGAQRAPPTSRRAWLRLDRSPSFSHARGQVARRARTGGGGDGKLHRRWALCFLSAQQFVLTFWTHQQCCRVNITSGEDVKPVARLPPSPPGSSRKSAFKTLCTCALYCFCRLMQETYISKYHNW